MEFISILCDFWNRFGNGNRKTSFLDDNCCLLKEEGLREGLQRHLPIFIGNTAESPTCVPGLAKAEDTPNEGKYHR